MPLDLGGNRDDPLAGKAESQRRVGDSAPATIAAADEPSPQPTGMSDTASIVTSLGTGVRRRRTPRGSRGGAGLPRAGNVSADNRPARWMTIPSPRGSTETAP